MNRILIGELAELKANLETKYGTRQGRHIYKKVTERFKGKPAMQVVVTVRAMNRRFGDVDIRPRPNGQRRRVIRFEKNDVPRVAGDTLPVGRSEAEANTLAFIGALEPPRPVTKLNRAETALFSKGDRVIFKPTKEKALVLHVRGDRYLIKTDAGEKMWVPFSDIALLTAENEILMKNDEGISLKALRLNEVF